MAIVGISIVSRLPRIDVFRRQRASALPSLSRLGRDALVALGDKTSLMWPEIWMLNEGGGDDDGESKQRRVELCPRKRGCVLIVDSALRLRPRRSVEHLPPNVITATHEACEQTTIARVTLPFLNYRLVRVFFSICPLGRRSK